MIGFVTRGERQIAEEGGDSLITAETSLIARFNSLQGRKKFPVRMRRELARKKLISCPFSLPPRRRRGPTALVLAFVIIVALWLWNASLLTTAADQNLRIIKTLTQLLPPDWASKAESALRIFGADRALLLVEGIAIAKLIMLAIAYPFRRGR